jgi:exodeoxyribonuclease VIII
MTEEQGEETPARKFGSAVHCAVLEPRRFEDDYAPEPDVTAPRYEEYSRPRATKAYREEVEALESEGVTILKGPETRALEQIQAAVRGHPASGVILDGEGPAEASIVWTDPETGVPVKIRPDWIAEDVGAVVDLKTTTDAGPESFQKDFFNYGYYRQAWIYLTGCRAAGYDVEHYTILAVEKSPPYATAVYRVRDDVMEWAKKEVRPLLDTFARCLEADEWPAYPTTVQLINLPPWAYDRIEDREHRLERAS